MWFGKDHLAVIVLLESVTSVWADILLRDKEENNIFISS